MAIRPPAQCRDMTEVRAEIDRIDRALVDAIAERFGYVERRHSSQAGQEANVLARQQVFDKVRARAAEKAAAGSRGAVAANGRLVHPARGGEAARQARGQAARLIVLRTRGPVSLMTPA
jgi:chorismate mutase